VQIEIPRELLREIGPVLLSELAVEGITLEVIPPKDCPRPIDWKSPENREWLQRHNPQYYASLLRDYPTLALRVTGLPDEYKLVLVDEAGEFVQGSGYVNDLDWFREQDDRAATLMIRFDRDALPPAPEEAEERYDRASAQALIARCETTGTKVFTEPADIALPSDYLAVVEAWGTGDFFGELGWYSPRQIIDETAEIQRRLEEEYQLATQWDVLPPSSLVEVRYRMGAELYPEPGGLLAWGRDYSGGIYYWLTEGAPDEWSVAYYDHEEYCSVFTGMGFAGFLLNVAEAIIQPGEEHLLVHPRVRGSNMVNAYPHGQLCTVESSRYAPLPPWEPGRPYPVVLR
jgi:hypothetical protein